MSKFVADEEEVNAILQAMERGTSEDRELEHPQIEPSPFKKLLKWMEQSKQSNEE